MDIGQLLGGAGRVGKSWRAEEDAQRRSREIELRTAELNRLAVLRQQEQAAADRLYGVQQEVPDLTQQFTPGTSMPMGKLPAGATPVAPTAVAPQTFRQALPGYGVTPITSTPLLDAAQQGAPAGLNLNRYEDLELYRPAGTIYGQPRGPASSMGEFIRNLIPRPSAEELRIDPRTGKPVKRSEFVPRDMSTPRGPSTPVPPGGINFPALAAAVEQVESGGRADAVSPKGAVGPMQTMPKTLTDPGFGVTPARDNSTAELRRVGQEYLSAMLQKYNGNLDYALAAYNWGPGNTDKWIAAGADPAELPQETRDYIPKVKSQLAQNGAPAQTAAAPASIQMAAGPAQTATDVTAPTTGAQPAPLEVPQTQKRNMEMADYYLANKDSVPYELQQLQQMAQQQAALLTRQRNEAAQLAQMYMRSGTAYGSQQAEKLRGTINQLDAGLLTLQQQVGQKHMYLQGMQGLRELATANDPRRLSGVLSQYMGAPVGIQPLPNGTYNYFVNGKKVREGMSPAELASVALRDFSPEARQAVATSAALENELALKRKYGEATVNAMRDIQKAIIEGEYKLADERGKKEGIELKQDASTGKWAIIKDKQTIYIVDPNEVRKQKTGLGEITLPAQGRPIIFGR